MRVLLGLDQIPQDAMFNPPETYSMQQPTSASLVWSIGIVLYYLLHNYSPYKAFPGGDMRTLTLTNQLTPVNNNILVEFKQLVDAMLQPEPSQRQSLYLLIRSAVFKKFVK